MGSGDAQTPAVKLGSVLFAPNEGPHFSDTRQVRGVQTADRTTTDDADFLHFVFLPAGSPVELRSAGRTNASVPPQGGVNCSIDTVRRLKPTLKKSDRLFFLIGIDAFRDVAKWREARALLAECDFIVASRPGYSLRDVAESLPEDLRPAAAVTRPFHKQPAKGDLVLPGVALHLLEGMNQSASATAIRTAAAQGKPLGRWLDPPVADYIRKHGLYRGERLEK